MGSPRQGTWDDGWTIWFLPWRKLLAGSATGKAVLAGRHGSHLSHLGAPRSAAHGR